MLRGYRGIIVKAVGLAALAYIGAFVITSLLQHSDALQKDAAERAEEYRKDAKYRIERVCPTAISKPDCITQAKQSARENERAEQDLAAQNITAWWTKVMGIAALIGMALSAVGVWLVKTTFDETRKSNQIALQAAAHEFGAFLLVEKANVAIKPSDIAVYLDVKNIGRTPASDVRMIGHFAVTSDWLEEGGAEHITAITHRGGVNSIFPMNGAPSNEEDARGLGLYWFPNSDDGFAPVLKILNEGRYPEIMFSIDLSWDTAFGPRQTIGISFSINNLRRKLITKNNAIIATVTALEQRQSRATEVKA